MAAGRGGGLSATIFKEDLGAVIGEKMQAKSSSGYGFGWKTLL